MMNAVTTAELAQIQSDVVAAVCDKSCQIQRKTTTSDGYLSQSTSYSTIATVMAGMAQPSGGQLANYGFLIGSLSAWQVRFPVNTNVQHQDHLVIAGQTLEVQVVLTPRSYEVLLTVLASEVK